MSRRTVLTLTIGLGLYGLYWLYALIVGLLINPAVPTGHAPSSRRNIRLPTPAINVRMAEKHLPSQPWASRARYQFRSDETFVYAQEWEQLETQQAVRFRPFALIRRVEGQDAEAAPLTVVSNSAVVKFASRFDVTDPNPGRVTDIALYGSSKPQGRGSERETVRITGPNGLKIEGRNFVFSEEAMQIWSDHRVSFAYGPHSGKAFGLQVELMPAEGAPGDDQFAVAGIKSIRLRRNVSMELLLQDGPQQQDRQEPVPIQIRSVGSFDFSLKTYLATFQEDVQVSRVTGPEQFDSLQCDRLTLKFEAQSPKAESGQNADEPPVKTAEADRGDQAAQNPSDSKQPQPAGGLGDMRGLQNNLAFRRLQAEGREVILHSESNDMEATMRKLNYDAQTNVAVLTGDKYMTVDYESSTLRCPRVTLLHNQDGRITSVWGEGRGWFRRRHPETGRLEFAARWAGQLRKYPDPKTNLEVIELEQQALLRQPEKQTGLAAEFIKVWYDRPDETPNEDNAERTDQSSQNQASGAEGQVRPRRLLARKNVALVSPEMEGETNHLEVWFDGAMPASPRAQARVRLRFRRPGRLAGRPMVNASRDRSLADAAWPSMVSAANGFPQVASPASRGQAFASMEASSANGADNNQQGRSATGGSSDAAETRDAPAEPPAPKHPLKVQADRIRLQLVRRPNRADPQVSEIWTEGHVRLSKKRDSEPGTLRLTGRRLHIENRARRDQLLHLYGRPAHVHDRKLHIAGRKIHLDRKRNLAWVTGTGTLQVPVKRSLNGQRLETPQQLKVEWQEEMTFDGHKARFFGQVRSRLAQNRMRCQQMHVTLTEAISFNEQPSAEQTAEIHRITCKDGVEFDSYEYASNKLISIRRAHFWEFRLNQKTGQTQAQGPGWIKVWRRGRGKRASLSPSATVRANQPLQSNPAEWEYVRIDFTGQAEGNFRKRETTFRDRVQVVYGPVERPLATLDPDQLPADAAWMQCDRLQFTQFQQSDAGRRFIELLARGNVELQSRSFHARADKVSYDDSKGLYVLRSLGDRKATIWRQKQPGGKLSRVDAQSMQFIPSENQLKVDRAAGLEGLQ